MKPISRTRLLTSFSLVIISACSIFHWERNVVQNGISFVKLRQDMPSGIYIGLTSQNFHVDSFEVQKGWVHFNPGWKIRTFQTARPVKLGRIILPAKTWISLDSAGAVSHCVLPEIQEIQGIKCRGGGGVSGITTSFYPSGKLKGCYPVSDIEVDGIPCSNTIFFAVSFHENGHLKSCKLSQPYIREGKTYNKGTRIRLEPDGTIAQLPN